MQQIAHLITIADTYKAALSLGDTTVSARVFRDSKKLSALRVGADITIGRYNSALRWFSANWPETANWPEEIERPVPETVE